MKKTLKIEYLNENLKSVYKGDVDYIPHRDEVLKIDGKSYKVLNIEPYLYTQECEQNIIRVFVSYLKNL